MIRNIESLLKEVAVKHVDIDDEISYVKHNYTNKYKEVERERYFLIAILYEAVVSYRNKQEPIDWFVSENNEPGSCNWVCDMLDIEKSYLLRKLKDGKNKKYLSIQRGLV